MEKTLAVVLGVASFAFGIAAWTSTAGADPKTGVIELTCGTTTFDVTTNGQGEFTPAHDVDSNRVFHPVAFGAFHGSVYDTSGVLVDQFTDPGGSTKGRSGKTKDLVTCTYSFEEIGDGSDPMLPAGFRFVGVGEVTGW
jgi:hypothetical protein